MVSVNDPGVANLLAQPNHAVISTYSQDGSIHSAVVWIDTIEGKPAINGAPTRKWAINLERNPAITVVVYDQHHPTDYVEIRGTAHGSVSGAIEHIDRLAKKYTGADVFLHHQDNETRMTYTIEATSIRRRHFTPESLTPAD